MNKITVELAGIYACAYRLCLKGYLPTLTPTGRFPRIDMLVYDPDKGCSVGLQVKTLQKKPGETNPWYFPPSNGHPTVYVTLDPLEFYVLSRESVDLIAKEIEKAPKGHRWVHKDSVEKPDTKDKWENIWK